MLCAFCEEKIDGKPIKQAGEYYCSLECANMAAGTTDDDGDEYYDEGDLEGLYEEEEE